MRRAASAVTASAHSPASDAHRNAAELDRYDAAELDEAQQRALTADERRAAEARLAQRRDVINVDSQKNCVGHSLVLGVRSCSPFHQTVAAVRLHFTDGIL